jgi:hypothetical protein
MVAGTVAKVSSGTQQYRHVLKVDGAVRLARTAVDDVARGGARLVRHGVGLAAGALSRDKPDQSPPVEQARPAAESPDAIAAGAPGAATGTAARAADRLRPPAGGTLEPADLPLDDYDHLTVAALRARLRNLTVDELLQLRAYEQAHADRLQVVTMLENRIAKLQQEAGANQRGAGGGV